MKTFLTTMLIALSFFNCKAQTVNLNTYNPDANDKSGKYYKDIDGNFDPFIGTWEGIVSGNITFRVQLFKEALPASTAPFDYSKDVIQGKYYLIEDAGESTENIICTGENMVKEAFVIIAGSSNGINMGGSIYDTCITEFNSTYGVLKMDITSTNTAHWIITRKGVFVSGMEYVIPTDIILTKQ